MTTKLSDIAEIILGYPFRGKIPEKPALDYPGQTVRVLQIKDITKRLVNQPDKLMRSFVYEGYAKFQLKKDDLVMPVRGGKYIVDRITQLEEPTIAVSQVFIIRCKESVRPAFLYWFLNLNTTQYQLKQAQTGTNIPMLNKAVLSNLKVELPSLEKQEKIAGLQSLWAKQKGAYEQLIENGNLLTQGLCKKLLESNTHAE